MSSTQILILVLSVLTFPLWLVGAITVGVWINMRLARFLERSDTQDPWQERVFGAEPRAGLLARGRGVAREGYWQTLIWANQGLHTLRPFRFPRPAPGGGLPVVLVSGYLENGSQMVVIGRRLADEGYQPVLLDLPSTLDAIETNAAWLAERLAEIQAESGYPRLGYVGHSMGGVVGRACTLRTRDPGLAVVIALASPHRGTHLARLGLGESARDLERESAFCKRYPPEAEGHAPIRTVIAREDNIVSPPWSAVLPHAETVLVGAPLGHSGILYDPEVHDLVVGWLGQLPQPVLAPVGAASTA